MDKSLKGPSRPAQIGVSLAMLGVLIVIGYVILSPTPSTTAVPTNIQKSMYATQKNKVASDLGVKYCKAHSSIVMTKVDSLIAQGYPMFQGRGSYSEDQCSHIMGNLYDVDQNSDHLQAVIDGRLVIGMDWRLLLFSWGAPNDANVTTSVVGQTAQWVYGDPLAKANYVYVNNGIVSSVQQ